MLVDPPASPPEPATTPAALPGGSSPAQLRRNTVIHVVGEGLWGLGAQSLQPATVVMSLLGREGAGDTTAGLISAADGGMGLFQLIGPSVFRSVRHRKRLIIVWHFLTILPALYLLGAALATPWLAGHPALRRGIVLAALCTFLCSIGVVGGVWMDWFAHLFHERVRGAVSGLVWVSTAIAGIIGQAVASRLVDHLGLLALLAGVFATASILLFILVDDPSAQAPDESPPRGLALWRMMRQSWAAPGVGVLLVARGCGIAMFILAPFITLQFSHQGIALSTIIACGCTMTAGNALAGFVFGRLGDRHGHRLALRLGLAGGIATLAVAMLATGITGCILCYGMLGLSQGIFLPSQFMLVETTPHGSRLAHLIACNVVSSLVTIIVPFIWAQVAAHQGLHAAEAAGMAIGAVGLALALWRVAEPRHHPRPAGGAPGVAASRTL